MTGSPNNQTIIIKRIKKVSGGHHGGAWKVAYADFVTAMMAFFILLWLLNATEAEKLVGLADYFAPTVGVKDEMGIGFRGGKAALSEGIGADKNTNKGMVFGGVPSGPITKVTETIEERTDQQKQEQIQVLINETNTEKKGAQENENATEQSSPSTPSSAEDEAKQAETQQALQNFVEDLVRDKRVDEGTVEIKRTPEGLLIEIKDVTGNSMFEKDSSQMRSKLKEALVQLSKILRNLPNNFAIIGHTSSAPIQSKKQGYTSWELSADRANETRSFLEKNEVQKEQISRIEGRADNVPFDARKPESSVNNRINIIILNKSDTPGHKKSSPDSLYINTKGVKSQEFIDETDKETKEEKEKKPIQNNEQMKQILEESSKIPNESKKIPANSGAAAPIKPADASTLVDFDKAQPIQAQPVAPLVQPNNSNQQFQNILNESSQRPKAKQ
jgi:chemotaxis protein MotB